MPQEDAKHVLEEFVLVLPLSELDKDMWPVFSKVLGWTDFGDDAASAMHANLNHHGEWREDRVREFDQQHAHTAKILEEHNGLDIQLYQWAKQRFDARFGGILQNTTPKQKSSANPPPA